MLKRLGSEPADALEDQCLDFKRWSNDEKDNKKNLLRKAVGFANQKGGTIVFGVENNQKIRPGADGGRLAVAVVGPVAACGECGEFWAIWFGSMLTQDCL